MTLKETRSKAFEIYKKHRMNSWILSIICCLFISAVLLFGILSEIFYIILVPFVILPFLFACFVSHVGLSRKDELSARELFGYYGLYYNTPFFRSFSIIRSLLKALLVELIVSGVVLGVCFAIYSRSETFTVTINEILEQWTNNAITNESLQQLLDANDSEVGNYINLTTSISFLFGAFAFILFSLRESITIYIRLNIRNIPLAHQIARTAIKGNSKKFNKLFFGLNWPFLLIVIAGMVGGVILSIKVFNTYINSGVIALSVSVMLSSTFLPFFFANNEATFDALAMDISKVGEDYMQKVFTQLEADNKKEEVEANKKDPDDTGSDK